MGVVNNEKNVTISRNKGKGGIIGLKKLILAAIRQPLIEKKQDNQPNTLMASSFGLLQC